jgi:predicted short-subunit dehydrogenase-like oxidoreductase (DUF2520 family)
MADHLPTLSIIGAGHLGLSLGRLWANSPAVRLQHILNSTLASTRAAIAFIGAGQPAISIEQMPAADIYLIGTPDDRIASCCDSLAAGGKLNGASVVFHCSGARSSGELAAASRQGAAVASIHPVRSFARPEQVVKNFSGTLCGVEGDPRALDILAACFSAIGAEFVPIMAEQKVLYHAGAVFASNYLVTLQDVAQATYGSAGIAPEVALKLMEPLVRSTIDNIFSHGPAAALSGPIARGDMETASKQLEALTMANPQHAELYRVFVDLTVTLAARKNGLGP